LGIVVTVALSDRLSEESTYLLLKRRAFLLCPFAQASQHLLVDISDVKLSHGHWIGA
jgi:hypothetical protein